MQQNLPQLKFEPRNSLNDPQYAGGIDELVPMDFENRGYLDRLVSHFSLKQSGMISSGQFGVSV